MASDSLKTAMPRSCLPEQRAYPYLTAMLARGEIPHGLLFSGPAGVGKRAAACGTALALNCRGAATPEARIPALTREACPCSACRKIRSGSHPDILVVEPDGAAIKIDQIRQLAARFARKPHEADMRVAIVDRAHTMTAEAANAFLKLLEEPPDRSVLILTASKPAALLVTIVSRCLNLRFSPMPTESIVRYLEASDTLAPDEIREMAILSGGSFSKAAGDAAGLTPRQWVYLRRWVLGTAAELLLDPAPAVGTVLAFSEQMARGRDTLDDLLEMLKTWTRDLLICRTHPRQVVNTDWLETLVRAASRFSVPVLLRKLDIIQTAQRRLAGNANLRLTLEGLLLHWVYG